MNGRDTRLCQEADVETRLLAHCKRLLLADLPKSGPFLENLVTTIYLPCKDWEAAAWASERAGDAWKDQNLRERAAKNYDLAATYYESAGRRSKALEMRALANEIKRALYF